jgi:HEAT repeat protein
MKKWMALVVFAGLLGLTGLTKGQTTSPAQATPAATAPDSDEEPDMPVTKPASSAGATVESQTDAAWDMLHTAQSDTNTKAQQARIDAIIALGTLGDFPRAVGWLSDAQKDQDRYVRLAAVTAMGSSNKTVFLPNLKQALDDVAPEVSFAAAVGLWKMDDKSGASVLDAVVGGDRKANRGLVSSEKLSALRARDGENGINPRVIAATLLAEDTSTAAMKIFVDAMDDHDPSVRAAAAKALGDYHSKEAMDALGDGFYDIKPAVRFMAAASYIRAAHPQPENEDVRQRKSTAMNSSQAHAGAGITQ